MNLYNVNSSDIFAPFMKYLIVCSIFITFCTSAIAQTFKYAFVTDTHVGTATGEADLRNTVNDINQQHDIDFIVLTGDITEMGTKVEISLAKEILSALKKPWYIIPGNHDTGWSESGGVDFIRAFGDDKFTFDHNGYRFIGCASGPYVRMSDGHIPRDAVVWLDKILKKTPPQMPVIFVNHYPVDNGLDNWYEAVDRIKRQNIKYAICGHGHANQGLDFEGIAGTMGRSNLRARDSIGGYNIVTMRKDSVLFAVKKPGMEMEPAWRKISLGKYKSSSTAKVERPSYNINSTYPMVKEMWKYHAPANVVLTPASKGNLVVFGNSIGEVEALALRNGEKKWKFKTKGAIYSSPVIVGETVILGSGDGNIYALTLSSGKKVWKFKTGASVLGSPVTEKDIVYIGGSDGNFRAIDVKTGKQLWSFDGVEGAIVGKPLIYEGKVIFGSWGRHLYAVDQATGKLVWKWNNGNGNRMFSPAMCTPVAHNGIIYIAAPDRFLTAIEATSGRTLWRSKEAGVRESIGMSEDGSMVFGKTMNDEVVAYKTQSTDPGIFWRLNLGFGYEHVPSMLIAKYGKVTFGTKNGVIYSFDPSVPKPVWAHKVDNSMVNTVNILSKDSILVATMDGIITLLKVQ